MDIGGSQENYIGAGAEPKPGPEDVIPTGSTPEQGIKDKVQHMVREEGDSLRCGQNGTGGVEDLALRKAGEMRTYSGVCVPLHHITPDMLSIGDIGTALSQICRFNGHVKHRFTVAEHSLIGSRMAPSARLKMEFLLHDAGEAYVGDIILPVKELFPEIGAFENNITAMIMDRFWPYSSLTPNGVYNKSPYVKQQDKKLQEWESLELRPTHAYQGRVWDTKASWSSEYQNLLTDMQYTPLQDIFVTEYYNLRDKL